MAIVRSFRTLSAFLLVASVWSCIYAGTSSLEASPQNVENSQQPGFTLVDGVAEHTIGRNDVLLVTVWDGLTTDEKNVRVAEDGTIFVPFGIDQNIGVAGLSSTEVKELIRQEALKYFRESVVQVVIEEVNSSRAYLLGEVSSGTGARGDGVYPLRGRKTVLEFIIEHGGFTREAAMTRVQVNRTSGERLTLNLSDIIFQGDESQNVVVNPGDIVWVPSREVGANTYYVFGEVGAPGVITADTNLSLVELISKSGSFTPAAERDQVFIARGPVDDPEIIELDLKRLVEKADFSQNVTLLDHDVIFVPRNRLSRYKDVLAAIAPIMGLVRDTILIYDFTRR